MTATFLSCNKSKDENNQTSKKDTIVTTNNDTETNTSALDTSKVPVSDKELGEFPFFSFPKGMKEMNRPILRTYDMLFFPINGVMTPIEGKVWKSYIGKAADSPEDWSLPFFERSYGLLKMEGIKIHSFVYMLFNVL